MNFYMKNNDCIGYSDTDMSKAIDHDTIITIDTHNTSDLPWRVVDGIPKQLTLEEATHIMSQENN